MKTRSILVALATVPLATACSGAPGTDGLRESFARQLAANEFISNVARVGDAVGGGERLSESENN